MKNEIKMISGMVQGRSHPCCRTQASDYGKERSRKIKFVLVVSLVFLGCSPELYKNYNSNIKLEGYLIYSNTMRYNKDYPIGIYPHPKFFFVSKKFIHQLSDSNIKISTNANIYVLNEPNPLLLKDLDSSFFKNIFYVELKNAEFKLTSMMPCTVLIKKSSWWKNSNHNIFWSKNSNKRALSHLSGYTIMTSINDTVNVKLSIDFMLVEILKIHSWK